MSYALPDWLWPPQRRGLEQTIQLLEGGKSVCLYGPTGSGKTAQAFELMNWAMSRGMKSIFYLNRKLLIDQTAKRAFDVGLPIGLRAADFDDLYDHTAPCQIASADTEWSRVHTRKIWPAFAADLVIIDELHIQKATKMKEILEGHKARGALVVGLTATPIGISHMVDELVVSGTLAEYRECKALVPAIVKSIEQPDMRKVKRNATGEFILDGQRRKIYTQSIVGNVIDRWKKYNPDARPTLLYAPGVAESVWFTQKFMEAGVNWAHIDATDGIVDGKRTKLTRTVWAEIQERFKDGDIRGISNRFKCLDSKTEILTRRGWVGPVQFSENDEVASLDLDTDRIKWSKPWATVFHLQNRFYEIKNHSLDVRVTHDHNLLVRSNCKRCRNWKLIPAEDAATRKGSFRIPVAGLEDVPDMPDLTDAQISLIGWFLTDGHVGPDGRLTICQSTSQPQEIHEHIVESLNDSGVKWKSGDYEARIGHKVYAPARHYRVSRKELSRVGLTDYLDKDMSRRLMALSRRQLCILLKAINYGDGSKPRHPTWIPKTLEISKGNTTFLSRLQALCVVRGMRANLHIDQKCSRLYVTPNRDYAVVRGSSDDDPPGMKRVRLVKSPTSQIEGAWCVATYYDTIVTRRNGKVAIVGNCREGLDLPFTYHAIFATPIGSLASYLQTIGRVLRYSPETPDHVLVTDHGGCYWAHGSPNHDRDWRSWWTLPEAVISRMHLDRIKERKAPEPIRCPKCEGERTRGSKCPFCGFEHEKSRRIVIQESGEMRTREGHLVRARHRAEKPNTQQLWKGLVLGHLRKCKSGRSKGITFSQMEAWFFREHKYFPPRTLKFMPRRESDWHNKIHYVGIEGMT